MAAPWYHLPRESPREDPRSGPQPRLLLGVLGASAAFAVFLVLSDPTSQPATISSLRARTGVEQVATGGHAAPATTAPAAHAVLASRGGPEGRFAALDGILAAAVAGSELAATRAHDEALRAFATQQAARYAELRAVLPGSASGGVGQGDPAHADDLAALREAQGPEFDQRYVTLALELNRALLAELDVALAGIEDVELRDAVERVRGSVGDGPTP